MQLVAPSEGVQTRNLVDQCPSTFIVCNQGGRWGVQTSDQHLAVIRAAHALMAAGDNEAALTLLAAFASPGVDAQC